MQSVMRDDAFALQIGNDLNAARIHIRSIRQG